MVPSQTGKPILASHHVASGRRMSLVLPALFPRSSGLRSRQDWKCAVECPSSWPTHNRWNVSGVLQSGCHPPPIRPMPADTENMSCYLDSFRRDCSRNRRAPTVTIISRLLLKTGTCGSSLPYLRRRGTGVRPTDRFRLFCA